jgi:hypothetical protein
MKGLSFERDGKDPVRNVSTLGAFFSAGRKAEVTLPAYLHT